MLSAYSYPIDSQGIVHGGRRAEQGLRLKPAAHRRHVEGHGAEGRKVRHRGIYLLPNLFTTAALFSGFYAIINGMSGQFANAAIAIFVAMVLDGLDGRVARLTNTQSAFGAEYDSLSDMVAFGVAPALVAFEWALGSLGKVGWMVAFIYVAGAALRLARFNTQVGKADKRYFIGLASPRPPAARWRARYGRSRLNPGRQVAFLVALLVTAAGVLMVSNIKYHLQGSRPARPGAVRGDPYRGAGGAFAVVFTDPPRTSLLLLFRPRGLRSCAIPAATYRRRKQLS
ncbi:CDP-diacylglycerol--serine O-phosphatidyltransferase [Pseudomonas aeruginosa]|uniref:CDP-diacylglycerol--serine O-phosphatidyltransferase n=2 Tax=Gammaproteobacteria TaxID=1236 RepID=UPI00259C99AF|nr:CDP-diacylglycerol--serine O-phosphatidyltransferase [Pseudomonas aeruginosa]MDM4848967.1 CDP-diacylglycerol--serine O-phosphatidyltransferase [Pseudomonas aeruginosa]